MAQLCEECGRPLPIGDSFIFQGRHVCGDCLDTIRLRGKGVGGWLLLLCLNLAVVIPIAFGYPALQKLQFAHFYSYSQRSLAAYARVDGWLLLVLATFSLLAALLLWSRRRYAPKVARVFLLASLTYSLVAIVLPRILGAPTGSYDALSLFVTVTLPINVFGWTWHWYLRASKRVEVTYGDLGRTASSDPT